MKEKLFTVLLGYPHYMVEDSSVGETYLAHVSAENPMSAANKAKVGFATDEGTSFYCDSDKEFRGDFSDISVLAIFPGHLDDLWTKPDTPEPAEFVVNLLYPDCLKAHDGEDYETCVEATCPEEAALFAQAEMAAENKVGPNKTDLPLSAYKVRFTKKKAT